MSRTEQVHFRLSPREKSIIKARAEQSDCSLTDYIRSRVLATEHPTVPSPMLSDLEDGLAQAHVDLFGLKAFIEQECGLDLSKAVEELDPHRETMASSFARHVARIQDLYLKLKAGNSQS